MYGDGSFTRSFQYVSDLVDGLIRLMNSNVTEPVNLGNPHEFTVEELAHLVKELTGNSGTSSLSCVRRCVPPTSTCRIVARNLLNL